MSSPRRLEQFFSSPENNQILEHFREHSLAAQKNNTMTRMFDSLYAIAELFADDIETLSEKTKKMLHQSSSTNELRKDIKAIQQCIHALVVSELLDPNGGIYEKYVELFLWNVVSDDDVIALLSSLAGTLNQMLHKKIAQLGNDSYDHKYGYVLNYINKNRASYLQDYLAQAKISLVHQAQLAEKTELHQPTAKHALVAGGVFIAVASIAGIFAIKRGSHSGSRSNNAVEMSELGKPSQPVHQ